MPPPRHTCVNVAIKLFSSISLLESVLSPNHRLPVLEPKERTIASMWSRNWECRRENKIEKHPSPHLRYRLWSWESVEVNLRRRGGYKKINCTPPVISSSDVISNRSLGSAHWIVVCASLVYPLWARLWQLLYRLTITIKPNIAIAARAQCGIQQCASVHN